MDNQEPEDIVADWLAGRITDEQFKAQVSEQDYAQYKDILGEVESWRLPEWKDREAAFEHIVAQRQNSSEPTKVIPLQPRKNNWMYGVAAGIAVLLGIGGWLLFGGDGALTTYQTAYGEIKTFDLPDGSKVTLNANSSIAFNETNFNTERNLSLDGTAFFDVEKGSSFVVEFESGTVQVLGTSFDINESKDYFAVRCFSGKVAVNADDQRTTLTKGQGVNYDSSKGFTDISFTEADPSWMSGFTIFDNTPFELVVKTIENQYDVEIDYSQVESTGRSITTKMPHNDLDLSLAIVFKPLFISHTIDGKKVTLSEDR